MLQLILALLIHNIKYMWRAICEKLSISQCFFDIAADIYQNNDITF